MAVPNKTQDPEPSADDKFSSAISRFSSSLSDLREFSELVESLIKRHKLKELETALSRYDGLGDALCQFDTTLKSDIHLIQEACAENETRSASRLTFEINDDGQGKVRLRASGDRDDLKEFDKTISTILRSESSVQHLHRSSLISLVSLVESFLSQLLHLFFQKHPSAVNAKEKQFTFEELSGFSSLDDARAYLVSWKIENLLRGSYDDWIDYFKGSLKLELAGIARHHDRLVENFQRRNLFVHNDGIVNKIYMSKISKSLAKPEMLSKKLAVSRDYLFAAIDRFESSFLQLAFELWAKCEKESAKRPPLIVHSSYDALQNKRWQVATEIAEFIVKDKAADEISCLMAKVNSWIARRRLGGLDAIRSEVTDFDVSAKDDLFRLARHCLLEESATAMSLAKRLVKAKRISFSELTEWPLFEDLRSTKEMASWLTQQREKGTKRKAKSLASEKLQPPGKAVGKNRATGVASARGKTKA